MELRPSEAAVLLAISNGIDNVNAIARALNASKNAVIQIVESLIAKGLIEVRKEGRIIKKQRLRLTAKGLDALEEARKQLQVVFEAYKFYRDNKILPPSWRWGLDEFFFVLPLLTVLGIITATELADLVSVVAAESQETLGFDEDEYEDIEDDWALDEQIDEQTDTI